MKKNIRQFKLYCSRLILFVIFSTMQPAHASANAIEWIENTFETLLDFLFSSCLEIPNFNRFTTASVIMDTSQSGHWVNVGHSVTSGKMLKIQWNTRGIQIVPRKYIILYRIDPRFSNPQLFILKYNYVTGKYQSDFHTYNNGILKTLQNNPNDNWNSSAATGIIRGTKYDNYFNFLEGRDPISISSGDVITISLVGMDKLLNAGSEFSTELNPSANSIASVFTRTGIKDNNILYTNAETWCAYTATRGTQFPNVGCQQHTVTPVYLFGNGQTSYNRLYGILSSASDLTTTFPICADNLTGLRTGSVCAYDRGRGMKIALGSTEIKPVYTPFVHSDFSNTDFLYYKSSAAGNLNFTTTIPIADMFYSFSQSLSTWPQDSHGTTIDTMRTYFQSDSGYVETMLKYLHIGRYIMKVEIGNSNDEASMSQQDNLTLSYKILPTGSPPPAKNSAGTVITTQEFSGNATSSGNLWLKIENPNTEVSGNVTVSYAYYTGSTFLSDILYHSIAEPVMEMMRGTAALFYSGLATNPTWQLTVRSLLTLYIILYTLSFLAGKVQITVSELVERLVKIAVVFSMFSASSWRFFNENVFTIFLDGMGYLANSVVGITSSVSNIFGFVDVIFDKYTNPLVWQILCVELLQIQNGMTYVAILMIEAILAYLLAVVDVVISFIMAFLTMCVLISLAPIFIVCMLFERSRSMFDNWLSLLFNHMIQPTILLIFFLLIDQLMINQFSEAVMEACWNWLITINIDLDLSPLGLDFRIKFELPFLPGVPFYTAALVGMNLACPFVSSGGELTKVAGAVLMFKIYSNLSAGLIVYVTNLVASLTNVKPPKKSGESQTMQNPTTAISAQLKAPFGAIAKQAKGLGGDAAGKIKRAYENPVKSDKNDKKRDNIESDKSGDGKPDGKQEDGKTEGKQEAPKNNKGEEE